MKNLLIILAVLSVSNANDFTCKLYVDEVLKANTQAGLFIENNMTSNAITAFNSRRFWAIKAVAECGEKSKWNELMIDIVKRSTEALKLLE